jgi:hypothetical protein
MNHTYRGSLIPAFITLAVLHAAAQSSGRLLV